jgi:DNA-3-methyladenine glycosylase I
VSDTGLAAPGSSLAEGADGRARCGWVRADPDYIAYHDREWGTPLHGDQPLFEKLSLEGFQAGLSWITILRRRPGFREAFDGFDVPTIAGYDDADVERLMGDERIIRNRAKIAATISNARVTLELTRDDPGALDRIMWGFAPEKPRRGRRPRNYGEIPAVTPESEAMSKELRALGYKFVGPTTMYALMQSAGMVDDHLAGCWRSSS